MKLRELLLWGLALLMGTQAWAVESEHAGTANTTNEIKIKVYVHVPNEIELEADTDIDDTESPKRDVFYSIGGIRLKIKLDETTLSAQQKGASPKYTWNLDVSGYVCDSKEVLLDYSNCDLQLAGAVIKDKKEFFWEPLSWPKILSSPMELTINFDDEEKTPPVKVRYKLASRDLKLNDKGTDVKVLESMLWNLGVSGSGSPGIGANRVSEVRRKKLRNGNGYVGRMISRFNYFSHTPIQKADLFNHPEFLIEDNYNTALEIGQHWRHYIREYYRNEIGKSNLDRIFVDDVPFLDRLAAEIVFDGTVAYKSGFTDSITPTYTAQVHADVIQYGAFNRYDILRAMAIRETGGKQTGYKSSEDHRFRMTVGGSDEAGSSGFNQIQNKYVYGGKALDSDEKSACKYVSAYSKGGGEIANHYNPGDNIIAKAAFLAGEQPNCGKSFDYAFVKGKYDGVYVPPANQPVKAIQTNFILAPQRETVTVTNRPDDNYEKLAKAIGAYNQGQSTYKAGNGNSWLDVLRTYPSKGSAAYQDAVDDENKSIYTRTLATEYALSVMHDADKMALPYRSYIIQGGTGWDADGSGTIEGNELTTPWCFEYGEQDWLNGMKYSDRRKAAVGTLDKPSVGRTNCL